MKAATDLSRKERTLVIDKETFSRRLWHAIKEKGLTYKETARRAQRHLPSGIGISDVSIWSYAKGRASPRRMTHVDALARALDMTRAELLGDEPVDTLHGEAPSGVALRELGDGRVQLKVCAAVPWSVAIEILDLVKGRQATSEPDEDSTRREAPD